MNWRQWLVCNEMVKAIQEKNYGVVKNLLNDNFDVDTELMHAKYPIMMCIENDSLQIGELFINHGCSLSLKAQKGNTPLHIAVQLLKFDFVKLLLDNRADLSSRDSEGRTVLHLATQMNSLRMVKLLMEKAGPGVLNIMDKEGKIPFIYACSHGNEALVSYYLSKGCDVNKEYGPHRNTPLISAISTYNCSPEKISRLLDAGANINHYNKCCQTPLLRAFHILSVNNFSSATYTMFHNICCLLIDRGSEVNVKDSLGNVPLQFAVHMNDEVLVRKLLNAGSLVNEINGVGFDPLHYACKHKMEKIVSMLLNSGGVVRDYQWISESNRSLLNFIIQRSKECQSLKDLCRIVIRRNLQKSIEKSASLLPLPPSVIRYIQLVE